MSNWLWAAVIIVAAAGLEGLCSGRDPMGQLKALKQPRWAPSTSAWIVIGIFWYGLCFTGLIRLLPLWPEHASAVALLVTLMAANAALNVPTFRMGRLDLAFYLYAPYWALLAAFLWAACPLDRLTCALFAAYAAYQLFAAAWAYQLWRMNEPSR